MQTITSQWAVTFDQFVASIQESAIIVAPYITRPGVDRLVKGLRFRRRVKLDVLTSLEEHSLANGAVDSSALQRLCARVPGTTVRHLLRLHAKAYVADEHTAIVTSSNLTYGGLFRNRELGIAITDPDAVKDIADDLREYGNLGVIVPCDELTSLDSMVEEARRLKETADEAASGPATEAYQDALKGIGRHLADLRTAGDEFVVNPEASINAQLCDAIRYVLRHNGPMSTRDMNPLVQALKPELCDDDADLVINGVSYGRGWKHKVRNAQTVLKRAGIVANEEGVRNGLWWLT